MTTNKVFSCLLELHPNLGLFKQTTAINRGSLFKRLTKVVFFNTLVKEVNFTGGNILKKDICSLNVEDPFKVCQTCGSDEISGQCIAVIFDKPLKVKQCPVCLEGVSKPDRKQGMPFFHP